MIKWLECSSKGTIFFNAAEDEVSYLKGRKSDGFLCFIDKLPLTTDQIEMFKMMYPVLSTAWVDESFDWVTDKDMEWDLAVKNYTHFANYAYKMLTPSLGLSEWY